MGNTPATTKGFVRAGRGYASLWVTNVTRRSTMRAMKTLTIRDFRTRPRQAQKALADEGEALLTSNGRPVALMLRVDSDSLDQTMETVRRARALQAVRKMRADAKARGLDRLGFKQIDAIIARSRKARRRRA
jgi:PHD/YefM family antitoxin component YafN of YafNO toxin-antitoxin module